MKHLPIIAMLLLVGSGCSSTEFDGTSGKASSAKKPAERSGGTDREPEGELEVDDQGKPTKKKMPEEGGEIETDPETDDDALEEDDEVGDESKCWFAVSGGYFGWDARLRERYANQFPGGTTSGNPIKHGEGFDSVGGIYLKASSTPYEYGKGNRELDKAVDQSFDAIAVAPGMTVEIRNAAGDVIHKGDGPYIATSNEYGGNSGLAALMLAKPTVPQWMVKHLAAQNNVIPQLALHPGRYVKVSKIKGKTCE